VETIEFVDDRRIRRKTSVDFSIPLWLSDWQPHAAGLYLPIAMLQQGRLRRFDLRDEDNHPLPFLGFDENNTIARTLLTRLAGERLNRRLSRTLRRDLSAVVDGPQDKRDAAMTKFRAARANTHRGRLWADPEMQALLNDLARNYFLFVPVSLEPGRRRIIKYAFDENYELRHGKMGGSVISPALIDVEAPLIGWGKSYHAEVRIPETLLASTAQLSPLTSRDIEIKVGRVDSALNGIKERVKRLANWLQRKPGEPLARPMDRDETGAYMPCLYVRGRVRSDGGTIQLSLRLQPQGLLGLALAATMAITSLLAAGLIVHAMGVTYRPDAAVAVLVALPGIALAYLVGPGEHPLVKRLVGWLRYVIAFTGSLSLFAGASLTLEVPSGTRPLLWTALLWLCQFPLVFLTAGWLRSTQISRKKLQNRRIAGALKWV
jgi:hypothetical protein